MLESLEDRLVPSVSDGTILVANLPSVFASTDQSLSPTGIIGIDPRTGAQSVVSRGGLFSLPTYITETPNGQLYITDLTAFGTGAVFRVDPNTGQQSVLAKGAFLNGPNVAAFVNGFLYVADEGDGSGTIHNIVRIDPATGEQTLLTTGGGGGFTVPTGMAVAPGQNVYVTDEPGNAQGSNPGGVWEVNLDSGQQTLLSQGGLFDHPVDVTVDASGNLIVANTGSVANNFAGSLFRINPQTGVQTLITLFGPYSGTDSVAVGLDGTLFVGAIANGTSPGQIIAVNPVTGAQSSLSSAGLLSQVEGIWAFHATAQLAATTTTVASSANPSMFGQSVTFTATVAPNAAGSGTPTGTVQFQIDGTNFGSPVSLNGGLATSPATSGLSASAHTVTASYSGDTNFSGSTAVMIQNVNAVQNVALMPDPLNSTLMDLVVVGTSGDDHIQIQGNADGKTIHVNLEETNPDHFKYQADYATSSLFRLIIYGGGGDDHIEVDNKVLLPALLFAGAGKDHIQAGGGPTVIVGGSGDDQLEGGAGNDILIAGSGKSHLEGKDGDDILIAGTTAFDNNLPALMAVMDEWRRADESYLQRIANLQNTPVKSVVPNGMGLNGSYLLNASTVQDSGAGDQLDGGPGMEWFFANLDGIGNGGVKDKLSGLKPGEVVTRITE
jgi:hypothetical protein